MYGLQNQGQGLKRMQVQGCTDARIGGNRAGRWSGTRVADIFWRRDGTDAHLLGTVGVPLVVL